jgi:eukaryotic-like serine/threonine-protein kinase
MTCIDTFPAYISTYCIEREIGRGSIGAVYLAQDLLSNKAVAIKTLALNKEFQGRQLLEVRRRFYRESEIALRLKHPAIVTILQAGEDPCEQLAYIAMEYLSGHNLLRYTNALLPVERVMHIAHQIAMALAHAHSQGVVHRDIKPANVMLNPNTGDIKLTDFGIAHVSDTTRTQTGFVLGTPAYMSPEQLSGARPDGRSDLYALGVLLHQLLTGHLPHRADNPAMLMRQIVTQPVPDIRQIRPELSEALAGVVAMALQKQPQHRYATGNAMAAALAVTIGASI